MKGIGVCQRAYAVSSKIVLLKTLATIFDNFCIKKGQNYIVYKCLLILSTGKKIGATPLNFPSTCL